MYVLLFLKQIVDMFYEYKILDYGMTIFAIVLLAVGVVNYLKQKREACNGHFFCKDGIFKDIKLIDYIAITICVLIGISFLRNFDGYGNCVKMISGFLLFFVGRFCSRNIDKMARVLAVSGYVIVFTNLIYALLGKGYLNWADGANTFAGLYYFKADLAGALVIAAIFIFFGSKIKVLKYLTIFGVVPYLVFISNSRAFIIILLLIYCIFFLYFYEKKTKKEVKINWKMIGILFLILIAGILILTALTQTQLFKDNGWVGFQFGEGNDIFGKENAQSRNIIWSGIMEYFFSTSVGTQIMGIDLVSEGNYNIYGCPAHSLYIRIIYSLGYLGCVVFLSFLVQIVYYLRKTKNRLLFYICISLWLIYMVEGFAYVTIESTQYAWFPMLLAGMVISDVSYEQMKDKEIEEKSKI